MHSAPPLPLDIPHGGGGGGVEGTCVDLSRQHRRAHRYIAIRRRKRRTLVLGVSMIRPGETVPLLLLLLLRHLNYSLLLLLVGGQ